MWGERSSVTNAAIVGVVLAALAGIAVLAWAVTSPGPDAGTTDDHLVYLLGPDAITVIDPETREIVRTIATKYDPEIAIAPDGATIYLTDGTPPDETLSVIDTRSWQVVDQVPSQDRIDNIPVGWSGMAVSADGRDVYIHKWQLGQGRYTGATGTYPSSDHWWDIYDTATQEFSDDSPHVPDCGIAQIFPPPNGSSLAVLCYQGTELVFVDLESGEVTGTINSSDSTDAKACGRTDMRVDGAAQAPDGTIYIATKYGCIRAVDPATQAVSPAFALDIPNSWHILGRLFEVSSSGDQLLLGVGPGGTANHGSREEWVIDLTTQSLVSTIPLEPDAWSMAINPDGTLLYVVGYESSLSAIEIATGEEAWRMTNVGAPEVIQTAPRP